LSARCIPEQKLKSEKYLIMEGMIGEIRIFAGNFAPRSWAFCNGQLLAISSNSALFSILGTTYGGDGRTTFALPDLRGRSAIQHGNGPGLSDYRLGQRGGAENNTLTVNEMPNHTHSVALKVSTDGGESTSADGNYLGESSEDTYASGSNAIAAGSGTLTNQGGNQSYNIRQPHLACHYIIALYGVYPSRS
jgi:microcystin-dependent protein